MANELDNGEFWLPPEFLTDDNMLMDYKNNNKKVNGEVDSVVYFPFDLPSAFGSFEPCSDLSLPVKSVVSTETESDEEDYLAGLTRKMARATLNDDFWKSETGLGYENQKCWAMVGSPQSTLCNVLGCCGCKRGSNHGSPNCPSRVSSPPAAAAVPNRSDADWDLLFAAAGELARMRIFEEANGYYQDRGLLGPPRKPSPVCVPLKSLDSVHGFYTNQSIAYKQLQVAQFQQLKQQQMMKQHSAEAWGQMKTGGDYQQNHRAAHQLSEYRTRNSNRPLGLSPSAWPTLQQLQQQQQPQQPPLGSGMRAVFLGNPGTKRECAGTGVFLPRQVISSAEARQKPACSTVLLPDRVVQALNLNLDTMDAQTQFQSRYNSSFSPDYDAALKYRNAVLMAQRRNIRPQPLNQEVRLPQEWTY